MFETIVIPLDGSATAEVAIPYAEEIAGRTGCNLALIFVRDPNDYRSPNIIQCYLDNIAEKTHKAASAFFAEGNVKDIKVQTQLLTGSPADEIINFAEKQPRPYIIMTSHGQSGASTRWSLGSVADKVARATRIPVGIIRASGDKPAVHGPAHLDSVLAPLDGSKGSECTFKFIKDMATGLKATVTFVQVVSLETMVMNLTAMETQIANKKAVENYLMGVVKEFQQAGINAKSVVLETTGDVASEINRFSQENHMDVVIMATHGRSGPRRWVMGSVADKVMREGNTPIVLIKTAD